MNYSGRSRNVTYRGLELVEGEDIVAKIRVIVRGDSMWPTYSDGEVLICTRLRDEALQIGDVVLAQHPLRSSVKVIKRIAEIAEDGRYLLYGDNPDPLASEDGHNFGPVRKSEIIGYIQRS